MPGASLALFADLGACHVQKSSVTICFSTRALRVEGDGSRFYRPAPYRSFYPRPPGGGRPHFPTPYCQLRQFLSAPSGWRATRRRTSPKSRKKVFLSTPSGWRATTRRPHIPPTDKLFLSTPSGWRATSSPSGSSPPSKFLSTPSGWRATMPDVFSLLKSTISIHALRVEGDLVSPLAAEILAEFLSTPSGWRATV